METTLKDLNI